jgi:protein-histidine N-methyltransferase
MDYETYCNRAKRSYDNKEWYTAYKLLKKVLFFNEIDTDWLMIMIKVCVEAKKYKKLEGYCKDFLAVSDSEEVWRLLVYAYLQTGQLEKASENCPEFLRSYIEAEIHECLLPSPSSTFETFIKWFSSHNGKANNIRISNINEYSRGVVASGYTKSFKRLLEVPKSLIIHNDTCITPQTQSLCSQFLSHHSMFSLFILLEKQDPNSFWSPYLSVLPTDFTGFPIFYSAPELELLYGSSLIFLMEEQVKDIIHDYNLIPRSYNIDYQEFLKARLLVSSRLYCIKEFKDISGLVPYADFCNHVLGSSVLWSYDVESECFFVENQDVVERNAEICIDYGRKSNIKLLLAYGFVLENNPDDEFVFRFKINKNDQNFDFKNQLLGNKKYFLLKRNTDDPGFLELIGFLRLKYLESLEDLTKNFEKYSNLKNIPFISKQNETQVLNYLLKSCKKKLSVFKSSIEEDIQKLQTNISFNIRNSIIITKGEKEILIWAIDYCTLLLSNTFY